MSTESIVQAPIVSNRTGVVFQSRWGFHTCSYETYRKLRRLNFLGLKARHVAANWRRWYDKSTVNQRVYVGNMPPYIGTPKRKTPKNYRQYKPMVEPVLAPLSLSIIDTILECSRIARMPLATQEEVEQLLKVSPPLSDSQLDAWLVSMEAWFKPAPVEVPVS